MTAFTRGTSDRAESVGDLYSDAYTDVYGVIDAPTRVLHATRAAAASSAPATGAVTAVRTFTVGRSDTAGAVDVTQVGHVGRFVAKSDTASAGDTVAAAVTHRSPAGGVHVRVWDKTGSVLLGILPQFETLQVGLQHNDVGAIQFDYPLTGKNADVFAGLKAAIVSVHEGTREVATGHFTQDGDDSAGAADRPLTVAAPGTLDLLSWIELYPDGGFNHLPKVSFGNINGGVTPGYLLLALFNRGVARGCLDGITAPTVTTTFTETHDSAGQPWPFDVWLQYDAGQSLLDVVKDLVGRGFIDTRMRRLSWDVFVQDTVLAADHPDVWVRRSRELTESPRNADRTPLRTALLMQGEGVVSTEVVDTAAVAEYGRREGNSGESGVTIASVLTMVGQSRLATLRRVKEGFTATYDRTAGGPQPLVDYVTGEFVRADWYRDPNTGANLPVRCRTISLTYDAAGVRTAELELNDLFEEADVILERKMQALTGGSSSVTTTAPPTPVNADMIAPQAPAAVQVDVGSEVGPDGLDRGYAIVSWPLVTANEDGTPFDDDGGYYVAWQVDGGTWTGDVVTAPGAATVLVRDLPPRASFTARVAASDYNGHRSPYAISATFTIDHDTTGPVAPSVPIVAATIGGLAITWDGHPAGWPTAQQSPDFDHVQAYVAATDVFANAVPMGGPLTGPGTITLAGLPYGVPQYVWLVGVDHAGNAGAPSDTGGGFDGGVVGTPTQVLGPDLGGGAVGPGALQFRDFGNKVPDGSFELAATRARLQADPAWSSVWSFVQGGASDGGWFLRGDASVFPNTVRDLPLITGIEAVAGDKVWFTFKALGSATANGQAHLVVRARDSAGAVIADTVLTVTGTGSWTPAEVGQPFTYTFPSNIATLDVLVRLPAAAQLGTWGFDAVNVRTVVQTAVIDQEAVGTAQIANAAIGDAQIGTATFGALQSGSISATYVSIGNGLLTTAAADPDNPPLRSGARLEFDATGIRAYDATSTSALTGMTVKIGADGTAQFSGTITGSGLSGGTITGALIRTSASTAARRLVIGEDNPVTGAIDGITFHPGTYLGLPEATWSPAVMYVAPNSAADGTHSYAQLAIMSGKTRAGAGAGQAEIILDPQFGGITIQMSPDTVSNPGQAQGMIGLDTNGLFRLATTDINWDNSAGFRTLSLLYGSDYAGIETQSGGLLRLFSIGNVYAQKEDHATYSTFTCLSLTQTSSREIKTQVARLEEPMLDKVRRIDPHRYVARGHEDDGWRVGFIAEHVEEHLPELTRRSETEDATLGFDVGGMVSVLWRAVQELDVDVKGRVEALEARVAALGSSS